MKYFLFLVRADLLLQEETFKKLQEFVKNPNSDFHPDHYNIIDLSEENDIICAPSTFWTFEPRYHDRLNNYINLGYLLLNFENLKKFLSLP